jgi:hypothetical protein
MAAGVFALLALAVLACNQARADDSDAFFTNAVVPHLRLDIARTNMDSLRREPRRYVRATVRDGDTVYTNVAVHLKGAAGSFRGVDDRPALTLNFDKFKDGQTWRGLDKFHLNNSVQDGSYLAEAVCAELFLKAGVPAARVAHARVTLNGRDLGLYVVKEGFDKNFLRRHFKNPKGNFYDGGFIREITADLELNSEGGDVAGRADLKALAAAAQEPDLSKRLARLEQTLDVDRFLSFLALEVMTWHWDGYAMNLNNYRVYHDPDSNRCVFIPHGMDQMFWDANGPLRPNLRGLVASALMQTSEGRRRYRERLSNLFTNVFRLEAMTNQISRLHTRLRPALEGISKDTARHHDNAVAGFRQQVVARWQGLEKLLSTPEPMPLRFDTDGAASLANWFILDPQGTAKLDQPPDAGGLKTLHIDAGKAGHCTASWRARVLLDPGRYVFSGRVRTKGVVPLDGDAGRTGVGAGLRMSQPPEPRRNKLTGDHDWQAVEYEFTVPGASDEVVLVAELRARKGEAWFDPGSLKLRRR